MEKAIRDRFHEGILAEARRRYAIAPDAIQLLDGFESFIYEFERDGAGYILRLGHSRRRSPDLIRGEVDWINYLAEGGAGVARAVLSAAGNLVEEIPDEENGRYFWPIFWRGYRAENELETAWLAEIPAFMKLRELDLYAIISRDVDLAEVGEESWIGRYMNGRYDRIRHEQPCVDLDFTALVRARG